ESGAIDLTIGIPTGDEPNIYARPLIENAWVCVLRREHPALERPWDLQHFAELDHGIVSLFGMEGGPFDVALAAMGVNRRIRLRAPYPALLPLLAAETDLVVTTTRWLARKLAESTPVVVRPPPFDLPAVRVPMVWHERSHRDPRQQWLRELISRIVREIEA